MCTFPRFDLNDTAYILAVLADMTPAWREVYTRIADELVGRHTTFWAAIDWVTLIGHDPNRDRYPPEWLVFLPERLRGRYDAPGWTGNGVEPWGLQPDPIGADGNLFFRGFFNLLLSIYRYVSGDDKWERPFEVTGYRDRRFAWTHHRIAEFLNLQWREQPQGPHCENTKIWPFCLSAAGLGLQLYDGVSGSRFHGVFDDWVEYAKRHYLVVDDRGRLRTFPLYYDPIEDDVCCFPDPLVAFAALAVTPYMVPQNPDFARFLYEESVRKLGWNNPWRRVMNLNPDPRPMTIGLLMARELGDATTEKRLREFAERHFEPRWFGADQDRFGWWFGLDEDYPRGQLSALLMLSETIGPGAWSRVFRNPNLRKFEQPTVEGVDYPVVGVTRAWNDEEERVLHVGIHAAMRSRRGTTTTFRVTKLENPNSVEVWCDQESFPRWRVVGSDAIEIETDVADHDFRIATGIRRAAGARSEGGLDEAAHTTTGAGMQGATGAASRRDYIPAPVARRSCCFPSGNTEGRGS